MSSSVASWPAYRFLKRQVRWSAIPISSCEIDRETGETVAHFTFWGSKITADGDCSHAIKIITPWKKSYYPPRQHIKKQRHYFVNKGPSSQGYVFFSSHVWMWELDYKQSWALENWCFWTVVLEKTLKSTLDSKEIQPAHPKGIDPEYSLQDWCWNWHSNTLATWCEELTYLKRPWCWERLKVGGEGDDRGWDGRMVSLTQ